MIIRKCDEQKKSKAQGGKIIWNNNSCVISKEGLQKETNVVNQHTNYKCG